MVKGILAIVAVSIGLYLLSLMPTHIDYKRLRELIRKHFIKVLIGGLILYTVYLNVLYSNVSSDNRKSLDEYFRMHRELDSLQDANRKLTQKIDSLGVEK
jgi:hypothetical protein